MTYNDMRTLAFNIGTPRQADLILKALEKAFKAGVISEAFAGSIYSEKAWDKFKGAR